MYLSRLVVEVRSRQFRRDYADIRQMHRTLMSAFDQVDPGAPARKAHGVLWRLDSTQRGFTQYVQSASRPDWGRLPPGYLATPAEIHSLRPVFDAVVPGRRLAFRLIANATRTIDRARRPDVGRHSVSRRSPGKTIAIRQPQEQIRWLVRQAARNGFAIPTAGNGQPDLVPSPCPRVTSQQRAGDNGPITIEPVRFDGHLIVTDVPAFLTGMREGIGRAKAYGCGLISLAPAEPISQACRASHRLT